MRQSKQSVFAVFEILIITISVSLNCNACFAQLIDDDFDFPYQALVLRDGAPIQSGPGQMHYPTQRLRQGETVKVFRHDPGGWCAIRPVTGSFSLVPESTLELVDEGIGKVTQDGTQAWVGTELGAVDKPLWQVKLRKDELVEVFGQVSWPSSEGHSTVWYQIASPAGEFRWIRMSDIQLPVSTGLEDLSETRHTLTQTVRSLNEFNARSPALDAASPSSSTYAIASGIENPANHEGLPASYQFQSTANGSSTSISGSINGGWRQATRRINKRSASSSDDSFTGSGFNAEAFKQREFENQVPGRQSPDFNTLPIRMANADIAALSLAGELNAARSFNNVQRGASLIKMIDLELGLTDEMVKNDPPQWRLDALETAANSILRDSVDVGERASAEKFLSKISKCRTIQTGYQSDRGSGLSGSATGQTRLIGTGIDRDVELDITYDAHGWLNKMVRNGGSSESTYVLQDASGRITHHVSPTPGLNLHRYLKTRVGIIGKRGYHSQLKLDHVTAHRVIDLENRR